MTAEPEIYYPHGFLGEAPMAAYVELARHRLGMSATRPATLPNGSAAPSTFSSAWGGLGAQLILSQLITGDVPEPLWQRLTRTIVEPEFEDFYQGIDGIPPVLAALAGTHPAIVAPLAGLTHDRVAVRLGTAVDAYDRQAPVNLGLSHGLAGTLLGYEIACALQQRDGTAHRHRAIAQLSASAVATPSGAVWPGWANLETGPMHALCNGGPGVCLAALLGYRYSGDDAYIPLIQQSVETVAFHTTVESLCCGTLGRVEVLIEAFRTTGDDKFLALARELFSRVDASRLIGADWKQGTLGYQFTALRLAAPADVDLPGLPMEVTPLAA